METGESKTFCIEPWRQVHFDSRGNMGPCCVFRERGIKGPKSIGEYLKSEELLKIKNSVLCGREVEGCKPCYHHESENKTSMRQRRNAAYGKDIEITAYQHLMLTYGNKCNMACRICNPSRSTLVERGYKKALQDPTNEEHQKFINGQLLSAPQSQGWYENKTVAKDIRENLHLFKTLEITGGEPFLNSHLTDLLEFSCTSGIADKLSISITTNGSFSEKHLQMLSSFQKVHLNISVDGVGDYYDLTRWPWSWEQFLKKINLIEKFKDSIRWTFVFVPHNINLKNISESVQFFREYGNGTKKYSFSFLNGMPFYHTRLAPAEVKESVIGEINALRTSVLNKKEENQLNDLINEISVENRVDDGALVDLLTSHTETLDQQRGQKTWDKIGWNPQDILSSSC